MYKVISSKNKVIHEQHGPLSAEQVMGIISHLREGLYYVVAPHWCFPIVVHDEDVIGLVQEVSEEELWRAIRDQLDYQQKPDF